MNTVSCYKLLLVLTSLAIHLSEQIKYINESSSIDVCKGKDVHLSFKVDEEENKINTLEWYFNNNTVICTSYSHDDFTVKPLYQGRIERISKTGIRLKNVSIDDEGIYILLPLIAWSATEIRVEIKLRVLEPPTNYCTCNASTTSEQKESYCGRPLVSCVWKRKQTLEVLGAGNLTLNFTSQDKEVLCCRDGEAMKCVDDNKHCNTVSLPHHANERPSENGSTQRTDSVNIPGTDTGSTSNWILVLTIFNFLLLTAVIVFKIICKMRKKNKDLKKNVPTMEMYYELLEAVNPLIKHDPRLETKAITVHQPKNYSEANSEVQLLQRSTRYPKLDIGVQ